MKCEACLDVAVDNVTVLSWKIFACAVDRMAKIISSYI